MWYDKLFSFVNLLLRYDLSSVDCFNHSSKKVEKNVKKVKKLKMF